MPADPKPEDWSKLGVAPGCSKAEARAAYLSRATALHPDRHPDLDLRLGETRITDAGLASVARVRGLQTLSLVDTRITDAGLAHLAGHPALAVLTSEAPLSEDRASPASRRARGCASWHFRPSPATNAGRWRSAVRASTSPERRTSRQAIGLPGSNLPVRW